MSSQIAMIEVYPDYDAEGPMNLNLPFSYSCAALDLFGYSNTNELIEDIKNKLIEIQNENN